MTRQELLTIATAIHFLPSKITDDQQKIIAESIANDLQYAGETALSKKDFISACISN